MERKGHRTLFTAQLLFQTLAQVVKLLVGVGELLHYFRVAEGLSLAPPLL